MDLLERVAELKEEKNAVILAHNYQLLEIQEVADHIGDSLELARTAMKCKAEIIVFAGVDFIAETAAILNPDKKVIVPCRDAECPMARQLPAEMVRMAKQKYYAPFVMYVNSYAEAKAEADICCTSANAARVVEKLDSETVLLGPDANLAWHAAERTGKRVVAVPHDGYCYVHRAFSAEDIVNARRKWPDAEIMVHPECNPDVQKAADFVGSTSQMYERAKKTDADVVVVGTEIGLIERMRREIDGKEFYPLREVVCRDMKKNTLERLFNALLNETNVVNVEKEIAGRAEKAIRRMVEL